MPKEGGTMKVAFFTRRDMNRKPIFTICLYEYGDNVAAGLAKCSKHDVFSRALGRKIAFGRAQKVLKIKNDIVNRDGFRKGVWNPGVTNAQRRLLDTQNPVV